MTDTSTPAPPLTDEQIECDLLLGYQIREHVEHCPSAWSDERDFDSYIAAVEARAARRERERISEQLESWAEDHKASGNTKHFAALHFASSMVHHDETNWPSAGGTA